MTEDPQQGEYATDVTEDAPPSRSRCMIPSTAGKKASCEKRNKSIEACELAGYSAMAASCPAALPPDSGMTNTEASDRSGATTVQAPISVRRKLPASESFNMEVSFSCLSAYSHSIQG